MKVLIWIFACLTYANALFFGLDHFDKVHKFRDPPLVVQRPHIPYQPIIPYQPHPPAGPPIQTMRVIYQQPSVPLPPPNAPLTTLIRNAAPTRIFKVIHQQAPFQQSNIAPSQESASIHVIKLIHSQEPSIAVPPPSSVLPTNVIHVIHTQAPTALDPGSISSASGPIPNYPTNPLGYPHQQPYFPPLSIQSNSPVPSVHVPAVDYSKSYVPPEPKSNIPAASYGPPKAPVSNNAPVYGPAPQKR